MAVRKHDDITVAHIATHPIRWEILRELQQGQPLYIKQLSERLGGLNRKTVAFHLMTLERYGLIKTYLKTVEPKGGNPVVVRYSELTDKARGILSKWNI